MGLLVQGRWVDQWYDTDGNGGRFIRQDSRFRRALQQVVLYRRSRVGITCLYPSPAPGRIEHHFSSP